MKFSREMYEEIVLILENDSKFYMRYTNPIENTYGKRREVINRALGYPGGMSHSRGLPAFACRHDIVDRDQIRRYFDNRYNIPQTEANTYAQYPDFWLPPVGPKLTQLDERMLAELRRLTHFVDDLRSTKSPSARCSFVNRTLQNCGWVTLPSEDAQRLVNELLRDKVVVEPEIKFTGAQAQADEQLTMYRLAAEQLDQVCGIPSPKIYTHPNAPSMYYRKGADGFVEFKRPNCPWEDCLRLTNNRLNEANGYILLTPSPIHPTPQEPAMNKPIVITTKTFVGEIDISTLADSTIYTMIATEEAAIKELEAIQAKPKRLVTEIAKRQAGIAALVAHLDSKE